MLKISWKSKTDHLKYFKQLLIKLSVYLVQILRMNLASYYLISVCLCFGDFLSKIKQNNSFYQNTKSTFNNY